MMLDFSVTLVITVINITILFIILRSVLFKPVSRFMAERAQRIQTSIDDAAQEKALAHSLLEQYQDKLKNADTQAAEIIKTACEKAKAEALDIITQGKAAADGLIETGRRQIEYERQAAFTRFKLEAASLVMAASARLVGREFSGDDKHHYADMLLEEIIKNKQVHDV